MTDATPAYEPLAPYKSTLQDRVSIQVDTDDDEVKHQPETPTALSVGKGCLTRCVCCAKNSFQPGQTCVVFSQASILMLLTIVLILLYQIVGYFKDASSEISQITQVTCENVKLLKNLGYNVTVCPE